METIRKTNRLAAGFCHGFKLFAAVRPGSLFGERTAAFAAAFALWITGIIVMSRSGSVPVTAAFRRFLPLPFFLGSWLFAGLPVLKNAVKNLIKSCGLDENFLMSVATAGAFAIGEWEEAAGVMIFYMIGELIQEAAVGKSRSSIDALLALKPDKARIEDGSGWKETAAADVSPGSVVLVRPGERIPLDGIIIDGEGSLDVSMLTGEAQPVSRAPGDEVRSGTVSINGLLKIKTTRSAGDSSAAKIIRLVESAREAKAKPERFITAFARWYTPLVVGGAALLALLPPLFIPGARFADWIYRALILLVISCPCALVVSIPLGYFAGIGGMSRRGIMVKGAVHLDSLYKTKNVAFDKTGTLTRGEFSVVALEPVPGVDRTFLLETAVLAERQSNHPIAGAILDYAGIAGVPLRPAGENENAFRFTETAGAGLEVYGEGIEILAGNRRLMESRLENSELPAAGNDGAGVFTPVYLARNKKYLGRILIGDSLREGAGSAVNRLREMGIQSVMLTGDTRSSAMDTAGRLGITSVEAELLPEDKLRKVERLARSGVTVFAGDGINDAPVLAGAHVGIAMGSGADAAVEAADVIIMTDDPGRVPEAIERARRTHRIVTQNVILALAAKGIFITFAGLGMANMWIALVADVGVALLAILNSARALR